MKNAVKSFDFYLLRLPALPISALWQLHEQREMTDFTAELRRQYQAPDIQEALYLASPELHQELCKWLARPAVSASAEDSRLVLTLYKYLLRMSSRCTPYGLFAGFDTGAIVAGNTRLTLSPLAGRAVKHARLDMNYVAELTRQVLAEPLLKQALTYFVNNSLYQADDTYRYYEYNIRQQKRRYYLVSVKATAPLQAVLAAAETGASYAHLLATLLQTGVGPAKATAYLEKLLAAQILVSELEPTVTGTEFYTRLLDRLSALWPSYDKLPELRRIGELLAADTKTIATYQTVQQALKQSFPAATSKDLIQIDLRLRMQHNTLSQGVVDSLAADLSALSGLYSAAAPTDLVRFAQRFYERYEEQEIPLLEALDSEAGIGYGRATGARTNHTPLVDNVRVPGQAAPGQVAWTPYRQLVFRKYQESQAGQAVLSLTAADLATLTAPDAAPSLPPTMVAMGHLVATSPAALDAGDFKFALLGYSGPGAMTCLARFAHADPALAAKLTACAEWEQAAYGDALLAEIVHLPESRIGNIIQRPQLRAYEIPFLGNASVPAEHQLPVTDLLVSVRQGQVFVRSKRLGKRIMPRLTTAHNYAGGLPVYKFLCDLQHQQDRFSLRWDWGVLQQQPYLPRIEYKHLIISRAQWVLPASCYAEVAALQTPAQLADFLRRYRLPRQVTMLGAAANELLLDFDCPLAVQLLAQTLKKTPALLYEFVFDKGAQLLTDGQQGSYVNEVFIPFARVAPAALGRPTAAAPARAEPVRPMTMQRSFALGSEWTYLKVYCGAKWADRVLTEHLLPCITELEQARHITRWFFIRYTDPDGHLRLRFQHAADPTALASLVGRLHQALAGLQQARIVQRVQYDTYHRELERYGETTMAFSERVFHYDSRAVMGFLNLIEGDTGERYRWLFAVRGVDALLQDFGLSLAEKAALVQRLQQQFFQEFNGSAALTRQLNDNYREVSRLLSNFLDPSCEEPDLHDALALFTQRSEAIGTALDELRAEQPALDLVTSLRRLLPSYLHMFLNRIFLANQRLHELVVYHYLTKHYASVTARQLRRLPATL